MPVLVGLTFKLNMQSLITGFPLLIEGRQEQGMGRRPLSYKQRLALSSIQALG